MAKLVYFLPHSFSSSSTSITDQIHRSRLLKIRASNSDNYPLASKVVIRNLPFSTNQSQLRNEFSKYGKIAEVNIVKDEAKKKSKGYAFIQYSSQEEAVLALESMDHQLFDGRLLSVEIAKPLKNGKDCYPKTSGPPQQVHLEKGDIVDG